jgi:bisphosphoglycerate-dependent phosphoglycerate mutase
MEEKNLQWRRTYNGEEPTMEKNLQWRRTDNRYYTEPAQSLTTF